MKMRSKHVKRAKKRPICTECEGRTISYYDRRGNHDHMNAHICTRCHGSGFEPPPV